MTQETYNFMCDKIQFGYNRYKKSLYIVLSVLAPFLFFSCRDYCGERLLVSEDGLRAVKKNPRYSVINGMAYSDRPVKGRVEFEVEIISHVSKWCGNIRLGIMIHKSSRPLDHSKIPFSCCWKAPNHCIWAGSILYNNLPPAPSMINTMLYGKEDLEDLRTGERVGILITSGGELHFLVNGKPQGRAASEVYRSGWDIYLFLDHFADCKATEIIRANMS